MFPYPNKRGILQIILHNLAMFLIQQLYLSQRVSDYAGSTVDTLFQFILKLFGFVHCTTCHHL